jgi:hypothetical protein
METAILKYLEIPGPTGSVGEFLVEMLLPLGMRNVGPNRVMVQRLDLLLQPAHGSITESDVTFPHTCNRILGPEELHHETLVLTPSLMMRPETNIFRCFVTCVEMPAGASGKPLRFLLGEGHVVLKNTPALPGRAQSPATIFVSFKDPEDFPLAEYAQELLLRAGFFPYLARNDDRAGAVYWPDKIEPAIKNSDGLLVIWTPNTVVNPTSVIRELNCALAAGIPAGLLLEEGTALPREYPAASVEYGGPFSRAEAFRAFAREIASCACSWRKGKPFFGSASTTDAVSFNM